MGLVVSSYLVELFIPHALFTLPSSNFFGSSTFELLLLSCSLISYAGKMSIDVHFFLFYHCNYRFGVHYDGEEGHEGLLFPN